MSVAILHTDQVKDATVTMTSGTPQNDVTKVQNVNLFDKVIGPAADYFWGLQVDFGAAATIQAVALDGLNLTDTGTVTIFMDDASDFTTPTKDTDPMSMDPAGAYSALGGWQPRHGRPFVYLINNPRSDSSEAAAASWSDRYMRVNLTNTVGPPSEGYLDASILWACSVFVPTHGVQLVSKAPEIDEKGLVRRIFVLDFILTAQEESELENLYFALARRGRVILHPTTNNFKREMTEAMVCTFDGYQVSSRDAGSDPLENFRQAQATFKEAPY